MIKDQHPLILVFYLDRELMRNHKIIEQYASSVNDAIAKRESNAMAFFIPTDGKEKIECINPALATPEEKVTITKLINDIERSFDIGQGADDDEDDEDYEDEDYEGDDDD